MTSQKLYGILQFLEGLEKKHQLQAKLESIKGTLANLVNQPAQPQYQSGLAAALADFEKAASQLGGLVSPSQYALIQGMGGAEFFDPDIAEKIKESVQKNAMTPSVALQFVTDLANRRAEFLATVRAARESLEKLRITASALEPGTADLAFLIPRDIFDNELEQFAKELKFISRLLQDFSEALTGKAEQVELEELSSSLPTVALAASVPVIGAVAVVVNKFLDAWIKIEKIRKLRAELAEIGMKGTALDELTEQITTIVDEVVEESTQTVLIKYEGSKERKNELATAISQDTRRLFGQIERGLTVEFRAKPEKDRDDEKQKALIAINDLGRAMQFPQTAPEPMLLKGEELLEGEIHTVKRSKKTTTQKTSTVTKKGVSTVNVEGELKE